MTDKEKIEQLQSLLDAYRAENLRMIAKADVLKKELETAVHDNDLDRPLEDLEDTLDRCFKV